MPIIISNNCGLLAFIVVHALGNGCSVLMETIWTFLTASEANKGLEMDRALYSWYQSIKKCLDPGSEHLFNHTGNSDHRIWLEWSELNGFTTTFVNVWLDHPSKTENKVIDAGTFHASGLNELSSLVLVDNQQSWVLQNANKQKMIYKMSKNNLWSSAYSLLTCPIIQRLIYILSSISWSRTVCTSSHEPLEHSNEFTLWGKRWGYWLETAWPVLVADEQSLTSKASKGQAAVIDLVQTKLRQQKTLTFIL